MSEANVISLILLGKEYQIKCQQENIAELRACAQYLETKLCDTQNSNKILNIEKLVVITALNLAHELLSTNQRLEKLYAMITKASIPSPIE